MKFNKLVRDKIPEIIIKNGDTPITHIASDEEYESHLKAKLTEEVNEFLEDISIEELADIMEVIYALCDYYGFSREELEYIRQKKHNNRGGFAKRIILDETN